MYKTKLQNIKNVIDTSKNCSQFFRIDCQGMVLYRYRFYGFLVDRNGQRMEYIGGGPVDGRGLLNLKVFSSPACFIAYVSSKFKI